MSPIGDGFLAYGYLKPIGLSTASTLHHAKSATARVEVAGALTQQFRQWLSSRQPPIEAVRDSLPRLREIAATFGLHPIKVDKVDKQPRSVGSIPSSELWGRAISFGLSPFLDWHPIFEGDRLLAKGGHTHATCADPTCSCCGIRTIEAFGEFRALGLTKKGALDVAAAQAIEHLQRIHHFSLCAGAVQSTVPYLPTRRSCLDYFSASRNELFRVDQHVVASSNASVIKWWTHRVLQVSAPAHASPRPTPNPSRSPYPNPSHAHRLQNSMDCDSMDCARPLVALDSLLPP